MFEQCKAHVGQVTRKYLGDEDTTTKAAELSAAYRFPATVCKSFVEVDGEIIDEDDLEAAAETIKLLVEVLKSASEAV
jgi:hypothetical protein